MTEMTAWVGWLPKRPVSEESHGDKARAQRRRAQRRKNEEEVRKVLKEKARSLYLGERGVSLEACELAEIRRRLSESTANHDFRDRMLHVPAPVFAGDRSSLSLFLLLSRRPVT